MQLRGVYQPIHQELKEVEETLRQSLRSSRYESILQVNNYLLNTKGKRLRPALVILCAKVAGIRHSAFNLRKLAKIASAIELIHTASLLHDDIIDHARLRHHKLTINAKWGEDVAISLGDYLYAEAFRLISECGDADIIRCISSATKNMCEGELLQVCERDNLELLRQHYLIMVKKKTAALFAASCQAGAMLAGEARFIQNALKEYGLNFGIAFQITDDCLDLIGEAEDLGKTPGADFKMGEVTLPILNLILESKDKNRIILLLQEQDRNKAFKDLRKRFLGSCAFSKTRAETWYYLEKAKKSLCRLKNSCFKRNLFTLADYVGDRVRL